VSEVRRVRQLEDENARLKRDASGRGAAREETFGLRTSTERFFVGPCAYPSPVAAGEYNAPPRT
jgi:hypothetical protein